MVIFIDESGTHKQDGHSTMAVVYVEVIDLEVFQEKLKKINKKLGLGYFHWADAGWEVRVKYFEEIVNLPFIFKAAIFKNPVNPDRMIEIVFQQLITELKIKFIFIDGKKPQWFEHKLKKVLRDKKIKAQKLKTIRSEISYPGLQVADAIAGLIRYYFDNPEAVDAKRLYNKLKKSGKMFTQTEVINPAGGGVS